MRRLLNSKSGATAIEYSLIASFIAILLVTALTSMGEKTATPFNTIATALN